MPKGKSNSNQYLQAYMLFAAGLPRLEIWNELKSTYGDRTVTTRSIGSWLKEFRALPESAIRWDLAMTSRQSLEHKVHARHATNTAVRLIGGAADLYNTR